MEDWKQEHIAIFKELAQEEFKIKDRYDSIIAFPVTSITAMSGYMYFMVTKTVSRPYDEVLDQVLITFSVLYYMAFLFTLCKLLLVFKGWRARYDDLPLAQDLSEYQDGLIDYHKDSGTSADEVKPNFVRDFNKALLHYYIKMATNNSKMNNRKREDFESAKTGVIVCAILFVFSSLIALYKILSI